MTAQAGTEIEVLRKAERKSAIYRHDLRHHMNYLNSCIMENRLAEAVDYIKQTCSEIDNTMIIPYSDNEPVNLILASYAGKAKEKDIPITIEVTAADFSRFQITDLCSLLSNALENALHACEQAESSSGPFIHLRMFEKRNKLCLMLRNSYNKEPVFEQGIPVSHNEGHGIGVKSIAYVVEKYHGVYDFSAEDGIFTFQMTM